MYVYFIMRKGSNCCNKHASLKLILSPLILLSQRFVNGNRYNSSPIAMHDFAVCSGYCTSSFGVIRFAYHRPFLTTVPDKNMFTPLLWSQISGISIVMVAFNSLFVTLVL